MTKISQMDGDEEMDEEEKKKEEQLEVRGRWLVCGILGVTVDLEWRSLLLSP